MDRPMPPAAEPSPSSLRRRMRLNLVTLAFSGGNAHLESVFLDDYVRESLTHVRIALATGALFYGSFAVLDGLTMPQHVHLTWTIRFAVVCPAILVCILLTFSRSFSRLMQPAFSALILVGGAGITTMVVIAPPPARDQYYAGLILVLIFSYTFIRARFLWATATGWGVVLTYVAAATVWAEVPGPTLVSNGFFLLSANLAGMATCYAMEYYARRNFFVLHLLDREREKVSLANAQLETKVDERTSALRQANSLLQDEIAERRRAEEERERLQQQLKQAEKLETIGKLAAGVAHDLNNILVGLVGYPELVMLELPADSPLREPLSMIRQSGVRAATIVQDLLTLSRQGIVDKTHVALNTVVQEYLRSPEHQQMQAAHPHVSVQTDLQADLLHVLGSDAHLSKVLMNLVANALEANLVSGSVRIATRNGYLDRRLEAFEALPQGEYVVLSVADTGIGIASEDLRRIFEPFFTRKKLGRSGTGLGMTLISSAVKDHGGFIDVRSTEGVGTTFEIYLPAVRDAAHDAAIPLTMEDCRGTESVLVVDDVAEQREIATRMLRKLGYEATAVASGEEAVELLRTRPIDILVLDMIMEPGIDGCETYRRIVEQRPGQRAVIASGFAESDRVREAQRLGAGPYVRKPYTLERIVRAIRSELARRPTAPQDDEGAMPMPDARPEAADQPV